MSLNSTNSREIRKFGLIAFVFFGCLSALGAWMKKPFPTYFFGALTSLGFGFVLIPSKLKPVYVAWLKAAHFLNKVVTTLILALAFYFVVTPSAFIKRIFGGRPLPVRPDKKARTYWVTRSETAQPRERFLKRY